ncbi:MAG: fluoride efflux transporter CrcB [Methylophaga sp.]|nr:fluoride efflux transporter CrcB [Methylophaga sp.]MAY17458.1 fluoride efflux transporter CrcB [Methylophaga sp.]MBN47400.1 fluoride efflux transporter CrcB [Methylophaga sp.]HAO25595.1 fluoride efflux transporter CrcB [Methylophaga sp.]HCD04658.1 fluoride efflux transporter CrcB [Methylophaga sp.]
MQLTAIAVGGAAGALLRFAMSNGVYKILGRDFPYGTLAVNVLGSLLIGILFILLIEKLAVAAEWRAGLIVGLLGAFTTFSTFSLETFTLLEDGAFVKAGLNVLLSVVLCLLATWLGISLGRQL